MKKRLTLAMLSLVSALSGVVSAAAPPGLQVAPAPIILPSTTVTGSGSAGARLTNTSTTSLTVQKLKIYGFTIGNMAITGDGCTGVVLDPGAGCSIQVGFSPIHSGLYWDLLLIYDSVGGSPGYVVIEGCGVSRGVGCQGEQEPDDDQ
jgi:hypothetical protein